MPIFMCNTCGTQFNPADKPPANCPICDDERQFVLPTGQAWTTHEALAKRSYNGWRELEPDLFSITTFPAWLVAQGHATTADIKQIQDAVDAEALAAVDDEDHEVGDFEVAEAVRHDEFVQGIGGRAEETARIDELKLEVLPFGRFLNGIARGARNGRHNRAARSRDAVEKSGLPDVGPAHDGDDVGHVFSGLNIRTSSVSSRRRANRGPLSR